MSINRMVRVIAGFFVMLSLALGVEGSPLFWDAHALWFTAFVGFNLFQSGITGWCPMDKILARAGLSEGDSCKT